MTAPQTLRNATLDPVTAAWLAGGRKRAVDALLVARLERRRIRVVNGDVADRGLDRNDPLDGAVLDALGARGLRDLETVRWRVSHDRRLRQIGSDLVDGGLLSARTRWGRPSNPDRPSRTAAGRRLLKELAAGARSGGAWEVALGGRAGLTDPALRAALEPPARPAPEPTPRRLRWGRSSALEDRHLHISGATSATSIGAWGVTGGFGGDCGGGGDGGGGC